MKQTLGGALPLRQYNDSTTIPKGLALCTGVLLCLNLAACATTQGSSATHGGVSAQQQTRQADVKRVSDQTLRDAVGDSAPLRYVVKPGDTLWDIADHFMVKPWYWPEIGHDNPQIANPHKIYPGDVLVLTNVHKRPSIKFKPHMREQPASLAIGTLPAKAISVLLDAPRLVTEKQLKGASYIVAFPGQHLLASEHMKAYARLAHANDPAQLDILSSGHALIDPQSEERIGYLARPVGHAEVMHRQDGIGTLLITGSERAIRIGDHLLPARTRVEVGNFHLQLPDHAVQGQIIDIPSQRSITSEYDVVVINLGARSGLQRGDVLRIQRAPRTLSDPTKGMVVMDRDAVEHAQPQTTGMADTRPSFVMRDARVTLPARTIGALMLFEVNEQTSLGLILESSYEIHKLDRVSAPRR